jgi:hypothetical protein
MSAHKGYLYLPNLVDIQGVYLTSLKNKSQEVFVKTVLATFLTFLLLLPVSAVGEIQTVTHTVKQPFGSEEVTHRSPRAIMDEIAALDAESAEVLQTIRGLL